MHNVKIRYPNGQISWRVVDDAGQAIEPACQWLLHLEQTYASPNSIKAYARHIARLGSFLRRQGKGFDGITIADFDAFLKWAPWLTHETDKPQALSVALRNQIVLAVKSFFRYISGQPQFMLDGKEKHKAFDSPARYKPFLEHLNQRRAIRSKEAYLGGDPGKIQKRILDKRLTPEAVFSPLRVKWMKVLQNYWLKKTSYWLLVLLVGRAPCLRKLVSGANMPMLALTASISELTLAIAHFSKTRKNSY